MDSFLAARQVGGSGRAIGIDMTEAQLAKARRLATDHGFSNVEFVEAHIEQLPLPDAAADVVISNGVINLAPRQGEGLAEAARVVRPGGRLAIADIVTSTQPPLSVTCDASLWAVCIGGAMQRDDHREAIEAAGFELADLKENDQYRFVSERAENATKKYGVRASRWSPSNASRNREHLDEYGWFADKGGCDLGDVRNLETLKASAPSGSAHIDQPVASTPSPCHSAYIEETTSCR